MLIRNAWGFSEVSSHSTVKPGHLTMQVCCDRMSFVFPPALIIHEGCMSEDGGIHVTTAAQIRHSPGASGSCVSAPVATARESASHAARRAPHPPRRNQSEIQELSPSIPGPSVMAVNLWGSRQIDSNWIILGIYECRGGPQSSRT